MSIKNMMEDITGSVLEEIIKKDENVCEIDNCREDIIAYVLNRIPPKYVTSERGILHAELDSRFKFQEKSDILFLIHEAISVINKRRNNSPSELEKNISNSDFFFPHILGEVLEETTFSIIPDIEVSLLKDGKLVSMVDSNWQNPYHTNSAIKGYFHFWPDATDNNINSGDEIEFELKFNHPKFKEKIQKISIPVYDTYKLNRTVTVPITLMELKNGEDASFLYNE